MNLQAIRDKARRLSGRLVEADLSTTDLDTYINAYYQNHLPDLLSPESLQSLFTCNTTAGMGEYGVPPNIRAVFPPVLIDGERVELTHDWGWFLDHFEHRYTEAYGLPEVVLYQDRALWLAPVPDKTYVIEILALYRPDPLVNPADEPVDPRWGEVLAAGAANLILIDGGDFEQAATLGGYLEYHLRLIRQTNILNWQGMRPAPQF
jgi:hypothetical protein